MSDDCTALVHPQADVCAFNRTRAATRQIFDALLEQRGTLAETVADFAATLREWRKDDKAAGEDGALYKKDSAADRVQIMTMHASKGLQFPIVFLAYGFANQVKKETPDEEKPAVLQERRRLLYVALTRAEHRLYLPWSRRAWEWTVTKKDSDESEKKGSGLGSAGSALLASSSNGFLGKAIQVYTRVHFKADREKAFAPERNLAVADGDVAKQLQDSGGQALAQAQAQTEGVSLKIPGLKSRRVQWDSFSMMQKHAAASAEVPSATKQQKFVVEGEPPREVEQDNCKVNADTLLVRNNVAGDTFHEIMETLCNNDKARGEVDFMTACDEGMDKDDSALMALIRQKMRKHMLPNRKKNGDSTEKTLLRMVQNALKTEIQIGITPPLALKDIPRKDRMAEVEFVVGENGLLTLPKEREGVLNGKIDLLVRVKDKVFILDWKTNSLTDYTDPKVIEEKMNESDYNLQYQLYSLAADAWLKFSGLALAGAAYLFVRGGEVGAASGVFVKEYNAQSIEKFRNDISTKGFFAAEKEAE